MNLFRITDDRYINLDRVTELEVLGDSEYLGGFFSSKYKFLGWAVYADGIRLTRQFTGKADAREILQRIIEGAISSAEEFNIQSEMDES